MLTGIALGLEGRVVVRRVLPLVLVAPLCLVAVPATAAQAPLAATIHADVSKTPGESVQVRVSALACAGGVVRVGERYITVTGKTEHKTLAGRANASGRAVFRTRVPTDAAKSAIAAPVYWTATGTAATCSTALQGVAASTVVSSLRAATVSASKQAGRVLVTVKHCAGGVATAYTVDSALRPHPVAGLRADKAGTVQHSFVPSKSATALYLDCAQAEVPGYAAGGIVLSARAATAGAAAARAGSPALPSAQEAAAAGSSGGSSAATDIAAKETCTHAPGPYAFPSLCGGTSLVSTIDAFRTSPSLHALQGNVQFHRDVLDKLQQAETLIREHPAPTISPTSTGALRAAGQPAAPLSYHSKVVDIDGSVTTSQVTYTSPEGETSTATNAGVDVSVTVNETVNKKWHLSFTFNFDAKTHQTQCPDPDGDVSYAADGSASISFKLVEPVLHIVTSFHFSAHGSSTVLVHTNDQAQFHAADLSAAAEADLSASVFIFSGRSHSQSNAHVSTTEFDPDGGGLGTALFDALRIGDPRLNQGMGHVHTFNPGGATPADLSTIVLLATVTLAASGAESAAEAAYGEFNTNAACLKIDIPDNTSVGLGSKHTFTVTISDKAGGNVTIPVQLSPYSTTDINGTMDPDHFEFEESAPQHITFSAPQDVDVDRISPDWLFKGLSKRGRLNGNWNFTVVGIGAVTITGRATVSDSDTCTTARNGGCDSLTVTPFAMVDHYSRRFSSTLSLLAHLPAGGNLDTVQQGSGTVNESGISESGTGSWTDSDGQIDCNGDEQCQCTQSGSWTEKQTDTTASGDLAVQALSAQRDNTGAIADLTLGLSAQANDEVDGAYVVTSASSQPPSPQCQPGSYNATLAASFGGTDLQLAIPGPITGWKINADWDAKTGGTLATTTVTGSADLSQLDGDDSGPVDASMTLTVSTAPSGQ